MAAPRKKSAQSTVSVPSGDVSSDAAPSASAPSASVPSTVISSAVFSRQQLEKAPERVFRFLMALGRYPVIMRHLEEVGYSPKDHQDGWDLLHQLSAYNQPKSTPSASSYKEALASLDRWDEPNFRRASAALQFRYPEQHAFLFHDLKAEQGERAVLSVQTFLDRVEALEHASRPERKASAKQDKEAVQLLYQRKILSSEGLNNSAHGFTPRKAPPNRPPCRCRNSPSQTRQMARPDRTVVCRMEPNCTRCQPPPHPSDLSRSRKTPHQFLSSLRRVRRFRR